MYDESYVVAELEKHKELTKSNKINLSNKMFRGQFFKEDTCFCNYPCENLKDHLQIIKKMVIYYVK